MQGHSYGESISQSTSPGISCKGFSWKGETPDATSSPIDAALHGLGAGIDSLHDLLANLENRIGTVLLPVPPSPEKSAGSITSAAPVESELLYRISSLTERLNQASYRVSAMLNRAQT